MVAPMDQVPGEELVVVTIGPKPYALPVAAVREVIPLVEPTPMPDWPDEALGLVEVRGELIPLLDVSEALGHGPLRLSSQQLVLIVFAAGRTWGVLVDGVRGVKFAEVRAAGALTAEWTSALCRGVISDEGSTVVVLDCEKLLSRLHLPDVSGAAEGRR